jgi:hypothetical protein
VRVLDMACGSGSFLIEAFDVLDRYVAEMRGDLTLRPPLLRGEGEARGSPPFLRREGGQGGIGHDLTPRPPLPQGVGEYDLHAHARQIELLTQCIYGVDKDEQAVAVARLNLLLKALHTRDRLPLLANIRCGDSLISGAADELAAAFGPDWRSKRPFNWQEEFPEVFPPSPLQREGRGKGQVGAGGGGFDVIVGNPPYVRQETLGDAFKAYVAGRYATHAGTADLYVYFIERAMQLLKPGGYFGFIVANKWLRASYGRPLRQWLKGQHIVEIVDFGDLPVFQSATTYPCILILRKAAPAAALRVTQVKSLDFADLAEVVQAQSYPLAQKTLDDAGWSLSPDATQAILDKMRGGGVPLGEYVGSKVLRGIITGLNEAFVVSPGTRNRLIAEDARSVEIIKPFLLGRDVKRYAPLQAERYLIFMPNGWTRQHCPEPGQEWDWLQRNYRAIAGHLAPFQEAAEKRWDQGEFWWELRPCDYYAEFEKPKIIYPDIAPHGYFTLDEAGGFYSTNTTYLIGAADKALLGILNSKLANLYFRSSAAVYRGGYLRFFAQYVEQIPIPRLEPSDPADVARHDRIVALVDEMLALQRELAAAERALDDARHDLARRIARVDREIDGLVYELYGLTEEEIRIVEEGR